LFRWYCSLVVGLRFWWVQGHWVCLTSSSFFSKKEKFGSFFDRPWVPLMFGRNLSSAFEPRSFTGVFGGYWIRVTWLGKKIAPRKISHFLKNIQIFRGPIFWSSLRLPVQ
jgi:hypothetical protein